MIALSGLALVLSVLCGWLLSSSITRPISQAVGWRGASPTAT